VERDDTPRRPCRRATLTCVATLGAVLIAGCSSASQAASQGPGSSCGTAHTAADVPVLIKIAAGSVNCPLALKIENQYAAEIRSGRVAGNGGGAPVTVNGWTCQGYNTPEVLSTGNASQCHHGSARILAVLPVPSPSSAAA
jgi:hypothetical protein